VTDAPVPDHPTTLRSLRTAIQGCRASDCGRPLETPLPNRVLVTVHPSSILRARDGDERHAAYRGFVDDLERVAAALGVTA
jgi:hypothetical protein